MGKADPGSEPLSDPSGRNDVIEAKKESADEGDPIHADTRKIQERNGGKECNLTDVGAKVHDLEKGVEVRVETYMDRIVIIPKYE